MTHHGSRDRLEFDVVEIRHDNTPEAIRPFPRQPQAIESRNPEIDALQSRMSQLEALVARDEEVLRKLLALLISKGVATREEILEAIR